MSTPRYAIGTVAMACMRSPVAVQRLVEVGDIQVDDDGLLTHEQALAACRALRASVQRFLAYARPHPEPMPPKTIDTPPGYMIMSEASELIGVSPATVRRWLRQERYHGLKLDGHWLMLAEDAMSIATARMHSGIGMEATA